jgi:site-specific recombinase XerD
MTEPTAGRALLTQLSLEVPAADVRVLTHRVAPPETLSRPDRRSLIDKRHHALLRVMGDCGLRNAELRSLTVRTIRPPRANSAHHLFDRGKGEEIVSRLAGRADIRTSARYVDVTDARAGAAISDTFDTGAFEVGWGSQPTNHDPTDGR